MKIGGVPVYLDPDGSVHFVGEFTIDCDGCPMAYGPDGCLPEPYDYLANAGYPGNWWGIVTDEYGNPYEQKESDPRERAPYPGLYVSTTAYVNRATTSMMSADTSTAKRSSFASSRAT